MANVNMLLNRRLEERGNEKPSASEFKDNIKEQYEKLTVKELKEVAKELDISINDDLKKAEIIEALVNND